MKLKRLCLLVSLAVLLATMSGAYASVLFQDDFSGIANGQPDPDWQNLVGDWVVQDGQYACGGGAGPWQWSVVKDLTVDDCIVSTDIVAIDVGVLLRVQNPTVGVHPSQFILLGVDKDGIHLYRDAWGNIANAGWTDGQSHLGAWAHVEISLIGEQFAASAIISGTTVTASIPEMNIPGIYGSGAVGYYGFQNRAGKYDNFVVSTPVQTGSVTGIVTAFDTGAPISGATVSCGGNTVATGGDGRYTISGLPPGEQPLVVSGVSGYYDKDGTVDISGESVTYDVALDAVGTGSLLYQDHFEGGKNSNLTDWGTPTSYQASLLPGKLIAYDGTTTVPDPSVFSAEDMVVEADAKSNAEANILLRFQSTYKFLAAVYVPPASPGGAGKIYFHEYNGGYSPFLSVRETPGLGPDIHVRATVFGSYLSYAVSDSSGRAYATTHVIVDSELMLPGSAGLAHNGPVLQAFDNFVVSRSEATGYLTGRITDVRTGSPVSGAAVHLLGTALSTTTNSLGNYSFASLNTGAYLMQVEADGYVTKQVAVSVNPGANSADVEIDPYQKIGDAKKLGTDVTLGMIGIVTAVFSDVFVIEDEDRAAGISVYPVAPGDLQVGEEVKVAGVIQTDGRLLMSGSAIRTGRSGVVIDPLGVNNRDLTGSAGTPGADNRDLLVSVWGKLTEPPATLPDGTTLIHITDGSSTGAAPMVGVPSAWRSVYDDDFSGVPNGEPAPGWLVVTGDWVVRDGQYSDEGGGNWHWTVVKDLILGDCSIRADLVVLNCAIIARAQNPTPGTSLTQFVLLGVGGGGITLYRDAWGNLGGAGWSDGGDHTGEWVTAELRMIGDTFSATATALVTGATATIAPRTLAGIYPTGYVGLYGFAYAGDLYDNVHVEGVAPLSVPSDIVQVIVPSTVVLPALANGDFVRTTGIAGKGMTMDGAIRGVKIRTADDLTKVAD